MAMTVLSYIVRVDIPLRFRNGVCSWYRYWIPTPIESAGWMYVREQALHPTDDWVKSSAFPPTTGPAPGVGSQTFTLPATSAPDAVAWKILIWRTRDTTRGEPVLVSTRFTAWMIC